jgi:hypothetical protein
MSTDLEVLNMLNADRAPDEIVENPCTWCLLHVVFSARKMSVAKHQRIKLAGVPTHNAS